MAAINLDFKDGDELVERDMNQVAESVLAVRLLARGYFGVATNVLREWMHDEWLEQFITLSGVFALVCQRLRVLHNVPAKTGGDPFEWLIMLLTLDNVGSLRQGLEAAGASAGSARMFCKGFLNAAARLVVVDTCDPPSSAAEQGVFLLPILLGRCLAEEYDLNPLRGGWSRCWLQPLISRDSKGLLIKTCLASAE